MQTLLDNAAGIYAKAPHAIRVTPAIPILYFGDHLGFTKSPKRIVTVALNPSSREFPTDNPLSRFPAAVKASGSVIPVPPCVKAALDNYFKVDPYSEWFDSLNHILVGFGASFYPREEITALHTDLLSPVATIPTWSKLKSDHRTLLSASGMPLWHDLVRRLRPHIILISVAKRHVQSIQFPQSKRLSVIHAFANKSSYPVQHAVLSIDDGHSADLLFAPAAQKPFGFYTNQEKQLLGRLLKGKLCHW